MNAGRLPDLPLSEWEDSRLYWQLVSQMMGKIRLKLHPKMNHWWHATLYISPRGITTGPIPYGEGSFEIEQDLIDRQIVVRSPDRTLFFPLTSRPIADCYNDLFESLAEMGVQVSIVAKPYDCKSKTPFPIDHDHAAFDAEAVTKAWMALTQIEPVFKQFRGRFIGKSSPVQFFWHSFDLAVTRFSGQRAPAMPNADKVTQEAYSHEVNSAGFWFGDDNYPAPAFYCYHAPLPESFAGSQLAPKEAQWIELRGAPMALLPYEAVRKSQNPDQMVLDFLQSSYEAGANVANWNRIELEAAV